MKKSIFLLLALAPMFLWAQKQIQPYSFTLLNEEGEQAPTIMIYASASAVDKVKFTLKDAKNEELKDKNGKVIAFEVFPFTETSFRAKFEKALEDILASSEETKENYKTYENELLENLKLGKVGKTGLAAKNDAVQQIRNIYQFFNALILTAFEYDTEPVAGILKYKTENVPIYKRQVQGFESDIYFKRQAKHLRKIVYKTSSVKEISEYDEDLNSNHSKFTYKGLKPTSFLGEILKDETIVKDIREFNINTRRKKGHKARVKFKKYAITRLAQEYNSQEFKALIEGTRVFQDYFRLRSEIDALEREKSEQLKLSEDNEKEILNQKKEIDSLNGLEQKLEEKLKEYNKNITEYRFKTRRRSSKQSYLISLEEGLYDDALDKSTIDKRKKELENDIESLETEVDNLNDELDKFYTNNKNDIDNLRSIKDTLPRVNFVLQDLQAQDSLFVKKVREIDTMELQVQGRIDDLLSNNENKIKNSLPIWYFKVSDIEMDINDGFVEHITVTGHIKTPTINESAIRRILNPETAEGVNEVGKVLKKFYEERIVRIILANIFEKEIVFVNEYPIGFSAKTDFADLSDYTLYAFEGNRKVYALPLNNVISLYVQRHQNDRLDFSPKDQVVRLPLDDKNGENQVELKKEVSSKLLNVNIFTDFNGLKESEPNGLVQFEVEKWVPIWTKRYDLGIGRSSNIGFFNYTNFNLTWAKLNDEDRELQVKYAERFVNNTSSIDRFVTFLDLVKYENISVGVDLNIASLDFPLGKTRLEINGGAHYGRIKVIDSLSNDDGSPRTSFLAKDVNTIRVYPDLILRIRPEERFGGYLRYRPFKMIVPNNDEFFSVGSIDEFEENRTLDKSWLHRFELSAFYTPNVSSDNKFFFRYRYTNSANWQENGYGEFQVGYLAYLRF